MLCCWILFLVAKTMNNFVSTKHRVFKQLVGPSDMEKMQLTGKCLKTKNFRQIQQKLRFSTKLRATLLFCAKKIEVLEFVQGVNFENTDTLEKGSKYLLNSYNSCEKIRNPRPSVDIANSRRRRGLSPMYIRRTLFHRSELGLGVELQDTNNVFFKPRRHLMQVSTLSAQLGLESELVDWYRDAMSVPSAHVGIEFSPCKDNQLLYRTNTASIPS